MRRVVALCACLVASAAYAHAEVHPVSWWLQHRDLLARAHAWCKDRDPGYRMSDCQTNAAAWNKWEAEALLRYYGGR